MTTVTGVTTCYLGDGVTPNPAGVIELKLRDTPSGDEGLAVIGSVETYNADSVGTITVPNLLVGGGYLYRIPGGLWHFAFVELASGESEYFFPSLVTGCSQ